MDDIHVGRFPIRAVSEMTGVNPATLRAWERRYGLIRPERSDSGHRLYSDDDVSSIRRIVDWLHQGVAPSQVGALLRDAHTSVNPGAGTDWPERRDQALAAIERFDEAALDALYRATLAAHPVMDVTESLTVPVLEAVGQRWESGEGLVAEEHFFLLYIRNALGSRMFHRVRGHNGKTLVAACIPGDRHDIGLLLFCLAAEAEGFRVVNLGADTPLTELPRVAVTCGASAIVLSVNYLNNVAKWSGGLKQLMSRSNVPVFVGGRESGKERQSIENAGAVMVGSNIREGLQHLWQSLNRTRSQPAE